MQPISITEINYAIHWIVIYPVDSAIQRLNNRGQVTVKIGLKYKPVKFMLSDECRGFTGKAMEKPRRRQLNIWLVSYCYLERVA